MSLAAKIDDLKAMIAAAQAKRSTLDVAVRETVASFIVEHADDAAAALDAAATGERLNLNFPASPAAPKVTLAVDGDVGNSCPTVAHAVGEEIFSAPLADPEPLISESASDTGPSSDDFTPPVASRYLVGVGATGGANLSIAGALVAHALADGAARSVLAEALARRGFEVSP